MTNQENEQSTGVEDKPQHSTGVQVKPWHVLIIIILIVCYLLIRSTLAEILRPLILIFIQIIRPVDIVILPFPYNLIGVLICGLGIILNAWANYNLLRRITLTEREPFHKPSALVVEGPFKYTRNPVYMSVLILLFGFFILLSSLTALLGIFVLFIIFNRWFIRWEEKKLEETFGQDYLDYKLRVKRWI